MDVLGLIAGTLISAIALYLWYRFHRSITKGEEFSLWPARDAPKGEESNEAIEAFVAAYRSGNAGLPAATAIADTEQSVRPALPSVALPASSPESPRPSSATPVQGEAFLSGAIKVAYLVVKAGLRDHHVFAHVAMAKLPGAGQSDPAVAQAQLDLLVCNAEMKPVAAIDIIGPDAGPADAARLAQLRALGIRYLRLSVKSLPKPDAVRALLYHT
jgi:hypothetical protein